jgi:uncharacterized membrane protein YhaH (DUF805 family)
MKHLKEVLSFDGRMSRLPYAAASGAILLSQYLTWFLMIKDNKGLSAPAGLLIHPILPLLESSSLMALGALIAWVLTSWLLAALSFRRAADAGVDGLWVGICIAPGLFQLLVIGTLWVVPPRDMAKPASEATPVSDDDLVDDGRYAVEGVLGGMAMTLVSVILGALVFGSYGMGMFIVTPIFVGATTAYIVNRRRDIGSKLTAKYVWAASFIGGIALLAFALEGILCIVVAAPLFYGAAYIGGALGRAAAINMKWSRREPLLCMAMLPAVFAVETIYPSSHFLRTEQSVEIEAAPQVVWQALLKMDEIKSDPGFLFRLGIAYPIRGEVIGEGVGALRLGVFSTGTATERITEWEPARKIGFEVLTDPPALKELSPYENVHAPHVKGYFITTYTGFELVPLTDGRTRVVERTSHQLKLDPIFYWAPIARWAIDQNNKRVLAHLKQQAEGKNTTVAYYAPQ